MPPQRTLLKPLSPHQHAPIERRAGEGSGNSELIIDKPSVLGLHAEGVGGVGGPELQGCLISRPRRGRG